jgi:hypothetical protein
MTQEKSIDRLALFVFNGDPICFIHVLLNALDIHGKGGEAKIIVEGAATRLFPELEKKENPLHRLWQKAKQLGLVQGACKACSQKMGTDREAQSQGLALLDDMNGHPGMAAYRERGFEIITF